MKKENLDKKEIEFDVHCRMSKRWADQFLSMLKMMEKFGKLGHSGSIAFYVDGDGDFHPEFDISTPFQTVMPLPKESISTIGQAEVLFDAG